MAEPAADPLWHSLEELEKVFHELRTSNTALPVLAIFWLPIKHPLLPIHKRFLRLVPSSPPSPTPPLRIGGSAKAGVAEGGEGVVALLKHAICWPIYVSYCLANAALLSAKIIILRMAFRGEIKKLKGQSFDILAKTWGFDAEQLAGKFDFYYGDLAQTLETKKVRFLLLCGNAGKLNFFSFVKACISSGGVRRLPEWCLLDPIDPWTYACSQISASLQLAITALRSSSALRRAVALAASRDCLGHLNLLSGMNCAMARHAVAHWSPNALLTLYEGHSWEKCAWWGARQADPRVRIVGYQHTVIFRESLALTHPCVDIAARSLPDIVLSLGEIPAQMLQPSHGPFGTALLPFGSYRHPGQKAPASAPLARRTILVTPEGLLDEVQALFTLAYESAKRLPEFQFILRTHPSLSIAQARAVLPADLLRQPNILASDKASIAEDFARSSLLIYRGSSSVLYAILQGLLPICYKPANLIDIDPLYELKYGRRTCETADDLVRLVRLLETVPLENLKQEWSQAASYVERYTIPVSSANVSRFLNELSLERH